MSTARATFSTSVANAHTAAETGGITFPDGTTASRVSAKAAYAAGGSYNTFILTLEKINAWEQEQKQLALNTLRATGDVNPL